jgi:hypothetical protein
VHCRSSSWYFLDPQYPSARAGAAMNERAASESGCATPWRLRIRANLRAAPMRSLVRAFPGLAGGQGFSNEDFGLKSHLDLCGHFILHWNARAPRAKRCRIQATDRPGGASL